EGIIDNKNYPFGKDKIQIKFPESIKIGLTQDEVLAIEQLELDPSSKEWYTRNVWLLSFYLAGIRVADVLEMKWKDVQEGRLRYQMNKNQKVVSLKIPEKALTIFSYYEPYKVLNGGYIFPELKGVDEKDSKAVLAVIRNANKKLNKYLKRIAKLAKINKNVTMHI
ncbi:tyrosine-type recombinase/integrase, partial [Chryseobacterium sp. HMWF001]